MPYAFLWLTMLARLPKLVLVTLGLGLVVACGSKTFETVESGGAAGKGASGGTDGGGDGGSGASDPKGGSGGGTSGSAGKAGEGSGGTSRGGTSNGGTGAGGTDVGGASGTGGSRGGSGGGGGTVAGAGGSVAGAGGTVAGAGGSVAGAGGTVAGAGGCTGICPRVACLPPISINVTGGANIAALTGHVENATTGDTLGDLQCYPSGPAGACGWNCQFYQFQIPNGDYTIVLDAPGYESKSVDFTVTQPTNCGCCGCGCGIGYQGSVMLEPDGNDIPECCSTLVVDTANCGTCGNVCQNNQACSNGACVDPA